MEKVVKDTYQVLNMSYLVALRGYPYLMDRTAANSYTGYALYDSRGFIHVDCGGQI